MAFRFDNFEADDELFELRRDGAAVRIEPRVFEVLLYLLRNRERVVGKEELIEHVWQANVTESALTRAIMELRRTLPEDAIKTVHRRGYRFTLDITESAAPATHPIPTPYVQPAAPVPARAKRGIPHYLAIASVIAFAGALLTAASWLGRRNTPAPLLQSIRLAVLPVAIADDSAELQLLGLSVGDLLSTRLERVPRLVVRRPEVNAALSMETGSIAELARRAGVKHVVSSSIRPSAAQGKARLAAILHEVDGAGRVLNTPLGEYDLPFVARAADVREFRAMRDSVTAAIVRKLLPALELPREDGAAPRNAEAYRLYLLGKERLSRAACDGETSLQLLERSLEIDPQFGSAWETYALAHYGLTSSCGQSSSHYQEALRALERARKLDPSSAAALSLTAVVLSETGRAREGLDLLRRARVENAEVEYAASYALCYTGDLDEATRRLERALAINPSCLADGGWTPNAYLYRRDYTRFLQLLPATDSPVFRFYRGYAEFMTGKREQARATLGPAFRLNPNDVFARLSQALLAIAEERPEEAREVLRQLRRERQETGASDGELTFKIAELFAMAGDTGSGLRELELAVRQGFACAPCIDSGPVWNAARNHPQFVSLMKPSRNPH